MREIQMIELAPPMANDDVPPACRVRLLDLDSTTCRWPLGDPRDPDFGFCNRAKIDGVPYCGAHAARAFNRPSSERTRR
jgi:GcrA cell cycle regulator